MQDVCSSIMTLIPPFAVMTAEYTCTRTPQGLGRAVLSCATEKFVQLGVNFWIYNIRCKFFGKWLYRSIVLLGKNVVAMCHRICMLKCLLYLIESSYNVPCQWHLAYSSRAETNAYNIIAVVWYAECLYTPYDYWRFTALCCGCHGAASIPYVKDIIFKYAQWQHKSTIILFDKAYH